MEAIEQSSIHVSLLLLSPHSVMFLLLLIVCEGLVFGEPAEQQLARWLKRFPDADADGDGRLTVEEAEAYRRNRQKSRRRPGGDQRGAPREFQVDAGWQADRFPDHAVCYRSPQEIAAVYAKVQTGNRNPITSYPVPLQRLGCAEGRTSLDPCLLCLYRQRL